MEPETRYARLGDAHIAYQVTGEAPTDLVFTPGSFSNVDVIWEEPGAALFLRGLASFCRLIRFDRRGTSASDPRPVNGLAHWESYADEVVAVMDAVGSDRAAIMALQDAGPMAMFFAATYPERTTALILANTTARWTASKDAPVDPDRDLAGPTVDLLRRVWGTEDLAAVMAPSRAADERFRRWYAKYSRSIGGPGLLRADLKAWYETDARSIAPSVHVPTLVVHRRDFALLPVDNGRYLADHIEGAEYLELAGSDGPVYWEGRDEVIEAVRDLLGRLGPVREGRRSLATVLFTDIAGSTERAREMGDRRWRELLDVHDDVTRRAVDEAGGQLIKSTGDGILATFDGPGRAISAALAMRDDLRAVSLEVRAGLHTGEIERRDGDVGGIAVHLGARVMEEAEPGEILVSRTVRDLVVGSDFRFEDRGARRLKGIDGNWELFAVT